MCRYMPAEAFDPGFSAAAVSPETDQMQKRFLDLQRGIRKGFQTAREWGIRAGGSLQPAGIFPPPPSSLHRVLSGAGVG